MQLENKIGSDIIREIASRYSDEKECYTLLGQIDFPTNEIDFYKHEDPYNFWKSIISTLEKNTYSSCNINTLLDRIARTFDKDIIFEPYRYTEQQVNATTHSNLDDSVLSGISLVFNNYHGELATLLTLLQKAVQSLQLPNNIEHIYLSNSVAAFYLLGIGMEQSDNILHVLQQENGNLNVSCHSFRDYLLTQIFVEGPDQARFELRNIPASTPSAEIARAVMSQYHEQMWPENRQAVIDYVQADGNNQRLRPSSTLHDNGINENGTLHVSPERTAGSINPILREQALIRVKRQIQEFAKGYPDFKIEANSLQVPTEYTLSFDAPSWSPPIESYGSPQTIDHHQVWIVLLPDFPMKAPLVRWQTDIFHPNIQPRNGQVCLGILAENYRPALDFKELCQMLVDIASFQNYAISGGYLNREAKDWAISEAGQAAIQARGGRALEQSTAATSTHNEQGHCLRIKRREI